MPFVYLLVFALISFQGKWPPPRAWLGTPGAALAPWTLATAFWLLAAWRTHKLCWQLARGSANHGMLWRRFQTGCRRQQLLLTGCFVALLYLGWGGVVDAFAVPRRLDALAKVIQFAPLVIALLLIWSQFHRAEKASHHLANGEEPFEGLWEYLLLQVRQNLLLVVPLVLLSVAFAVCLQLFPALENDKLFAFVGLAFLVGALIAVPFILRIFLGLRPMATGPLRDRLEAAARRMGFKFSDILVWDTRHCVANAMVSGVLPWLRYIVLTDLLIEKLTPDEVEAVFGHEVGHVKHHHMSLYIVFFVGSLAMLTGLWQFCESAMEPVAPAALEQVAEPGDMVPPAAEPQKWALSAAMVGGPVLLAAVSAYVFVVFGFLSRRCERQADLYGCRVVSSAAFIAALDKVAYLNGIPRQRTSWLTSWQHPSIAQRVEFIEKLSGNPALEAVFQRSLLRLKIGLMTGLTVALAGVVVLVASTLGPEHVWDLLFRMR